VTKRPVPFVTLRVGLLYTVGMQKQCSHDRDIKECPIGVFDSGIGGLTVAREITQQLPGESILYFGDTLRCPYGPRPLEEIRGFAHEIARWLANQGVKLMVIACNSATAAALTSVQRELDVPVIGVVEPGARAAMQTTVKRRVGVIGTAATIDSGIYEREIAGFDAGITTFSAATPKFVEMVEEGLLFHNWVSSSLDTADAPRAIDPRQVKVAHEYLDPLKGNEIDTLVLGCTHYPLLTPLIAQVMGPDVHIISSAEETARDVAEILGRKDQLADTHSQGTHRLVTTATDAQRFMALASSIFLSPISELTQLGIDELVGTVAAD